VSPSKQFYRDAWDEGVLIVAAAGNSGDTGDLYPASYKHVMSVAAVDRNNTRPGFSQCNNQVEISAPGVDVLSTIPNGYAFASGTSMACPHVAGVAAEVWSRFPDCTNSQIRNVLLRASLPIGEVDGCNRGYGTGLVQAKAAYDLLAAEGCEAGGDANADPEGGCKQSPDYDKSNPHEKTCVSAGIISGPSGMAYWVASSLFLCFLRYLGA
jgi:serine protease